MASEKIIVTQRGGGSLVGFRPVFTHDSRHLICASGHNVKVLSIASGECVRSLHGHTARVTSIIISPQNKFQVLTGSVDGTVIKWDIEDGVMIYRFSLGRPLYSIYSSRNDESPTLFYCVTMGGSGNSYNLISIHLTRHGAKVSTDLQYQTEPDGDVSSSGGLKKKKEKCLKAKILLSDILPEQNMTAVGVAGKYVVSAKSRAARVLDTDNMNVTLCRWDGSLKMTCVAAHPSEISFATGLSDGKIVIWRQFLTTVADASVHPKKKVIHWHSLAVLDLAYSPEGTYLISGGYECVLVKWHTETHQRDTLPRLGAPICVLAPSADGQLYAVGHTDNGLQVITNAFTVRQTHQGLVRAHSINTPLSLSQVTNTKQKPPPGSPLKKEESGIQTITDDLYKPNVKSLDLSSALSNHEDVGLHYDVNSRGIVTGGRVGQLQFYDFRRDEHILSLDVTDENYVSSTSLRQPITSSRVRAVAVDPRGDWLVSHECWAEPSGFYSAESRLKFWRYLQETKSYELNTCVDTPHASSRIDRLTLRSFTRHSTHSAISSRARHGDKSCVYLVSVCWDERCFKLWTLVDDTNIYRENVRWSCDFVGSYNGLRPFAAEFSEDGSLLAVGFGGSLTLWDPLDCTVRLALPLSLPELEEGTENLDTQDVQISHLAFGSGTSSHIVYCCYGNIAPIGRAGKQDYISAGDDHLLAYNLLSRNVRFALDSLGRVTQLLLVPHVGHIVLFASSGPPSTNPLSSSWTHCLRIFDGDTGNQLFMLDEASRSRVTSAILVPGDKMDAATKEGGEISWLGGWELYYINEEEELLTLAVEREKSVENRVDKHLASGHITTVTPLSQLIAERSIVDVRQAMPTLGHVTPSANQRSALRLYEEIVDAPLHVLAPVSSLCTEFIHSLMLERRDIGERERDLDNVSDSENSAESSSDESSAENSDDNKQQPMDTS